MSRPQSWRDVTVGLVALASLVLAGALVLIFARVGALHGRTVTVYGAIPDATGVLPGTEVWLAGQKIGRVQAVGFRPPSADTALRVLVTLDILAEYQTQIQQHAQIAVRPGTSLIGSPVLWVASGRAAGTRAVRSGDTLYADPTVEFEALRTRLTTTAGTELPVLLDNLRVLAVQLRTAQGTLGALGVDGAGRLAATGAVLRHIIERASAAGTSLEGRKAGKLATRARTVLARLETLRARIEERGTSVGRFRTDSTLWRSVDSLRVDLADVQRLLDSPDGTIGRARKDAVLQQQLAAARVELDALFEDARRNPLRYIAF